MNKTPEQRWKDAVVHYRKNCQSILEISKSIRYAGVINEYGRTLTGMIRPGLKPILKQEDAKNEFFIISNLITLRQSQSNALGPLEHAIIQHRKATLVCIPDSKVVYYVSINPKSKTLDEIIRKVKGII